MRLDTVPKRPSIPIILQFGLILWGTSALLYSSLANYVQKDWFQNFYIWIIIASLIAIFILGLLLWLRGFSKIIIWLIAILFGVCLSVIFSNNLNNNMQNILSAGEGEHVFEVEDDQKVGTYTNNCDAKISGSTYKVKLQVPQDFEEVHAGDIIKAKVKFSAPIEAQASNYWQNGLCANARASEASKLTRTDPIGLIFTFRNHLITTIRNFDWNSDDSTSQAEQLLSAIICGQRIDLNSGDLYDGFKCAGLAHLVAVSGAHLSLVTAILLVLLKKLRLKKWLIIFIQSIFILSYLICAAVPISALRAAFMAYIALFSFFSKRRPAPLNALGICIIILIALDATTSVSVSFALSAGSTIGIILFSSLFEYWIAKPLPKCPEFVRSALALTFAASICSQPLSIAIFNQLPLVAPLSNIICTPIFTILCGGGLVAAIFASCFSTLLPILSKIFMFSAYSISELMSWAVRLLSSIPYSSVPATLNIFVAIAITLIICFTLYIFWPRPEGSRYRKLPKQKYKYRAVIISSLCVIFVLIFVVIPKTSGTELVMLDVGQGDSILLRSGGKSFLIDTGNQDSLLKTRLAEQGISHLDGVLITHPDDDHCGSLDVIEQLVAVDNIYVAKDLPNCNEGNCQKLMTQIKDIVKDENIVKMKVGDKINFGEIELEIIWPDKYQDNGGNCDSLTCVASVDVGNDGEVESRSLLCGDAEKDEITSMIKKQRIPKIDIYKCGHHGSANALYEKNAKTLSPKITLISVGAKNRYGHPNSKTIQMLESAGSQIYRTDQNGTITCKFVGSQIQIKTEKQ